MYWAAERKGGKIVHANKARAFGEYRCPSCRAEVFLRAGPYRVNHFAHMPHQGRPECEDFHFSGDLARPPIVTTSPPVETRIDPLRLAIELDPESQKHKPKQWRPCLIVPKSPDTRGEIAIDLGAGDVRRVGVSKLAIGHQVYRVDPDAEDFAATWVSRDVCREYREAVEHRIAGLDPQHATVFLVSSARQKMRTFALFWGESYYLVWRSDRPLMPPQALAYRQLDRFSNWDCALFSLPHEPSPKIEEWLLTNADVTVARASRCWALVYPAPYAIGDDGELLVPSGQNVLLTLRTPSPSEVSQLTFSARTASFDLSLSRKRSHVVSMRGSDSPSDACVAVTWDGSYLSTMAVAPLPELHSPVAVRIGCAGPDGTHFGELHNAEAQVTLARVRRRELSLSELKGHPSLTGQLRIQSDTCESCSIHDLVFLDSRAGLASLPDESLQLVNSALQDTSLDVVLDFGPFGRFEAGPERHRVSIATEVPLRLPRPLRARIEWLSRICRSYVDDRRQPIALISDAALLGHLAKLRVPLKFAAYQRSIDVELRTIGHGGANE